MINALRLTLTVLAASIALLAGADAADAATTWTVTRTDDPAGKVCQPGDCSLRQAITSADAGDTVVVPASATPYTITKFRVVVDKDLTITGAGAGQTTISGADATAL